MKRYIATLASLLPGGLFMASCNMITYPGEFKTDGIYEGAHQAYIDLGKEGEDTLSYVSFAVLPVEQLEYIVEVPVKMIGAPSSSPLAINVETVPDKTTAEEGTQYELVTKSVVFPSDSLNASIKVKLFREGLGLSEEDSREIVLKLADSKDLTVAFADLNRHKIRFDNYLDLSGWEEMWSLYGYNMYFGEFNRTIFMKFLELYDYDQNEVLNTFFTSIMFAKWAQTKQFFIDHPEFGITAEDFRADYSSYTENYIPIG